MYSLDINFLKDRPENQSPESAPKTARRKTPVGEKVPMYIGVGVGLLLPAIAGGVLWFVQSQTADVRSRQAQKETELTSIQGKIKQVEQIQSRIAEVKTQTNSVIGVFNQIKPWSAILQDIRDRTPPNLQIKIIQEAVLPATASPSPTAKPTSPSPSPSPQGSPKAGASPSPAKPSPAPSLPPPPLTGISITGTAKSFDDVNIFLLSLKQSPFFRGAETRIQAAQRTPNATQIELVQTPGQTSPQITYELPQVITYTIQTRLSDTSAADLLAELERKGAVGLATRIRTIQKIQTQGAN